MYTVNDVRTWRQQLLNRLHESVSVPRHDPASSRDVTAFLTGTREGPLLGMEARRLHGVSQEESHGGPGNGKA